MQTVILAAGKGTRMRPLTDSLPKPMVPVADRPLLAHVADAAVAAGASRLVLVVGYDATAVREYLGDSYAGVPVTYAEQPEQRGTADALRAARDALTDGPFVVLNGDVLIEPDELRPLYTSVPAVGAIRVDNPSAYGVLELDPDGERVGGVIEKPDDPPSDLANAGTYAFPASALEHLDAVSPSTRGELEITDVLDAVCRESSVTPVQLSRWLDVGRPWELLAANEWKLGELAETRAGDISADAVLEGTVAVEAGATVRAGVTIEGPALIRRGACVGPNAYLRGATLVGPEATVGHAVEVKNSVLFEGATVGHQSYVGDSLLGPNVNFGAGTNVANLRHDDKSVRTVVKGERVSSGRRKYGVVVGEGVKTGIDTSLNAGVVLPSGEYTMPGEVVLESRT